MMPWSMVFASVACVVGVSMGQLLFKRAALFMSETPGWQDWIFNGWLLAGLAVYGVATLAWIGVLRHVPLYLAYPFMGLAFLIVPCMGALFLDEPVNLKTLAGGILILIGIALAASSG